MNKENQANEQIQRPASIYSLTCGCSLLLLGSVADVVGSRWMYLLGCLLQCLFTLACGLSKTGTQLVIFRAFSGIAASFCLPSAVSIINSSFPPGRRRNMAFASMGGGQPIGFGIGLVLGGVLAGSIGWQWAFHFTAVVNLIVFVLAAWQLPKNEENAPSVSWQRLISDIDWIGAFIASTSLAMLSYVLAYATHFFSPLSSFLSLIKAKSCNGCGIGYTLPDQRRYSYNSTRSHPRLYILGRPARASAAASANPEHVVAQQSVQRDNAERVLHLGHLQRIGAIPELLPSNGAEKQPSPGGPTTRPVTNSGHSDQHRRGSDGASGASGWDRHHHPHPLQPMPPAHGDRPPQLVLLGLHLPGHVPQPHGQRCALHRLQPPHHVHVPGQNPRPRRRRGQHHLPDREKCRLSAHRSDCEQRHGEVLVGSRGSRCPAEGVSRCFLVLFCAQWHHALR